jgi:hypothetical protein
MQIRALLTPGEAGSWPTPGRQPNYGRGSDVRRESEKIIVEKNRKRAFWALVIVLFMALVSLALILAGVLGAEGILWTPLWLGTVGLLGFGASAGLVVRTMRAPWHLALDPEGLTLHTQAYRLRVPWENVVAIGVDEVNFREGCVLAFEDPDAVAAGTRFLVRSSRPDVVADAERMRARMEENYDALGYHLGIPGRLLELGPEELAGLLARARSGALWKEGEQA